MVGEAAKSCHSAARQAAGLMAKKPKRIGEAKSALQRVNFWLITLGVVVAAFMAAECLVWWRGGL